MPSFRILNAYQRELFLIKITYFGKIKNQQKQLFINILKTEKYLLKR